MRFRSLLVVWVLAVLPVQGEVVDRILAVVDGRPVTLNEVRLLEQLRGIDRAAATAAVIDERLMFQEAARLSQTGVTPEEAERAYQSLLARLPEHTAAEEPELRALARRETAVLKYVEFRFRPQVRVKDEDVAAAYQAELSGKPGAPPFADAAPVLRRRLEDHDLGEKIEAWVAELRAAADIRYNP
jgi:hypothetical protein